MSETLTDDQAAAEAIPELHAALEHLIRAWDHLYRVEQIVGCEITTEELAGLAGGIDQPDDVRALVSQSVATEWLQDIRDAAK